MGSFLYFAAGSLQREWHFLEVDSVGPPIFSLHSVLGAFVTAAQ